MPLLIAKAAIAATNATVVGEGVLRRNTKAYRANPAAYPSPNTARSTLLVMSGSFGGLIVICVEDLLRAFRASPAT